MLWGGLHSMGFIYGVGFMLWGGSSGAHLHGGDSAGAEIRRVWIGNGKATGVTASCCLEGRYKGHCQGAPQVKHFAGLQQSLGHPVLCVL